MPRSKRKDAAPPAGDDAPKKPQRTGKPINVWITDDLHEALETFIKSQRVAPRKTDVVELSLQEFLQREGYWPASK